MRGQLSWWGALVVGLLSQSTLLPLVLPDPWLPDVTLILVYWVALTATPKGGVVLAFLAGLALDVVAGAPPGFHAVVRVAVYALCRPFRGVFFDDRPLLLLPFAALATLVDSLGVWVMSWLFLPGPVPFYAAVRVAGPQALVEALAVPVVFLLLEALSGKSPAKHRPARAGELSA